MTGAAPTAHYAYFLVPMSLYFRIFKGLGFAPSPDPEEVIRDHRMKIGGHIHVFEVPLFRRISKLPE